VAAEERRVIPEALWLDEAALEPVVWITWESQRRNRELAAALGVRLIEWAQLGGMHRAFKYPLGIAWTIAFLLKRRPAVVICQNPSIVLAALLMCLRSLSGISVLVDAHNAGLRPLEGRWKALNRLAQWLQRQADLTIVSNDALATTVKSSGGRPFVLPDRIPDFGAVKQAPLEGTRTILFVCTYAADEPYRQVFEAAASLPAEVIVYVTGNYRKKHIDPTSLAPNVRLTGFVSEDLYIALLASVDVVMDLTDREDCLVCGAYEAMALAKPMILSDTRANRLYFSSGVVYARHDVASLADAMREALRRSVELQTQVTKLRTQRTEEWEHRLLALKQGIHALASR
jgi:glycosyltransferase involved in cell wall biosynthesis